LQRKWTKVEQKLEASTQLSSFRYFLNNQAIENCLLFVLRVEECRREHLVVLSSFILSINWLLKKRLRSQL